MSTISSVTSSTAATQTAATAANATSTNQEDRFLTLLVAQMKNQDPMNPMDNAAVTSQMAQISTVNGVNALNDTMKSVIDQLGTSQMVQGAALAGRNVLVPGNSLDFSGTPVSGGFSLPDSADAVKVSVVDAAGNVVHSASLGAQQAGLHSFEWDGMTDAGQAAPSGKYTFKVDSGTKGVTATTLSTGQVLGVSTASNALQLDLGSLGSFGLSDVKQIL